MTYADACGGGDGEPPAFTNNDDGGADDGADLPRAVPARHASSAAALVARLHHPRVRHRHHPHLSHHHCVQEYHDYHRNRHADEHLLFEHIGGGLLHIPW